MRFLLKSKKQLRTKVPEKGLKFKLNLHRVRLLKSKLERRCKICGVSVTNENLGGSDRKSALAGDLYCLTCTERGPE